MLFKGNYVGVGPTGATLLGNTAGGIVSEREATSLAARPLMNGTSFKETARRD